MAIDRICGMQVDEAKGLKAQRDGQTFYFCSDVRAAAYNEEAER